MHGAGLNPFMHIDIQQDVDSVVILTDIASSTMIHEAGFIPAFYPDGCSVFSPIPKVHVLRFPCLCI